MGKVVEKKTKKKGRPSLLDLQQRRIQEENEKQQRDSSALKSTKNYNHATPTPPRRSSRQNTAADSSSPEHTSAEDGYGEEMSSDRGRREKKLKLVLKLPNSSSAEQRGSDSEGEEEDDATQNQKKRKIAAVGYGSGGAEIEKGVNLSKSVSTDQGIQLDSKVSGLLPDIKLLHSVLDRIQKKDTYGVFSEPVDPEELPDYHEIIEHPMDFGTVRKKLDSGAYVKLEQFESDVFLICSNGMQYNAPETVYFRQARAIQELAKKSFENLRQDDDEGNIAAPEPKRRGRPPNKNLKRPPLDRYASSDATLASGGENAVSGNYDLRKAQFQIDKSGLANSSGRPRVNDIYANWVSQYRYDRNDVNAGSSSKGSPMKWGKIQAITDEDRRSTYNQFDSGHEPSVLATFSRERKQLVTVGLHSDHGYGRSLARFAADLGPVAWKMASKTIEQSLPSGVEFGPGWVGENDLVPPRLQPSSEPDAKPSFTEVHSRVIDSREKVEAQPSNDLKRKSSQPLRPKEEAVEGSGLIMSRPQGYQNVIHPGSNGFNNTSLSYNNIAAAHMGKLIGGGARPPSLGLHHHPNPSSDKEDYNAFQQKREQQRSGSAPPDLNVRFNSPPSSAARGESAQPDLALQL